MNTQSSKRGVDSSGFRFFDQGLTGEPHELAHRLLDEGRELDGFRLLGAWLRENESQAVPRDPKWTHLHWHQAVFEIAAGELEGAHARFQRHILPAVESGDALTDGPSLLWRLTLAGGSNLGLEWGSVRDAAVRYVAEQADRGQNGNYVSLHHLLAFAGARDIVSIDRWIDRKLARDDQGPHTDASLLLRLAWGIRSFANGDWLASTELLKAVLQVGQLGGSRAQNELFVDLRRRADLQLCAA